MGSWVALDLGMRVLGLACCAAMVPYLGFRVLEA